MARQIGSNNTGGFTHSEWLIEDSSDLENIPAPTAGSVAYTADLSYMAMYDGSEWQQIGGGS